MRELSRLISAVSPANANNLDSNYYGLDLVNSEIPWGPSKSHNFIVTFISDLSGASDASRFHSSQNVVSSGDANFNKQTGAYSSENIVNEGRVQEFKKKFERETVWCLKKEGVEPGVIGRADRIIEDAVKLNRLAAMQMLNDLYIEYAGDVPVASGILMLIGRLPFEVAGSSCLSMVASGLMHKSDVVKEAAIRTIEGWSCPAHLSFLDQIDLKDGWISEYMDDVKEGLREIVSEADKKSDAC